MAEVALTPAISEQARACRVRKVAVVEGVVRSWSQGCVDRAFWIALELFGIKELSTLILRTSSRPVCRKTMLSTRQRLWLCHRS